MNRQLAATIAATLRSIRAQIQLDRIAQQQRQRNTSGTYLDYDADTGTHRIKTGDGKTVSATLITNAGLQQGDQLSVSQGEQTNWVKTKPR